MVSRGDRLAQLIESMEAFALWHHQAQREHVLPGITMRTAALIHAVVQSPGLAAGDVARRLRISPALVTKLLGQTTEAGYVRVEKDAQDGRFRRIHATPAAQAVYESMMAAVAARTETMFKEWSDGELALFATLLERGARTQTPGETAHIVPSTPLLMH